MKPTRHQLRRLYWIDVAFQWGHHPSAPQLGRELGVSRGTIHRDLQSLRTEFHAPVSFDPTQGGYSYARAFLPDLPDLLAEEMLEMAAVLSRSGDITGSALAASLKRLDDRIRQLLPLTPAMPTVQSGSESPSTNKPETDLTEELAAVPPQASEGEMEADPVEIHLRFGQAIAAQVMSAQIFKRNEVQLLTDGGIEVFVTTSQPDAFLRSLLRWAPDFDVANPPWIRRKLPQLLERILKQYSPTK
jgi:predicted DNA-binding transcriptional regulator YafY